MALSGDVKALIQANNSHVFAGTNNSARIYRSTDNGQNWTQIVALGSGSDSVNAFAKVASTGIILAAVSGSATAQGIWRSLDHGATWTRVKIHPSGAGNGYYDITAIQGTSTIVAAGAAVASSSFSPIIRSSDQGVTWADIGVPQYNQPHLSVSSYQEGILFTAYPGEPYGSIFAFYGTDTFYTAQGGVGRLGGAVGFSTSGGGAGNGGLDMLSFLYRDSQGQYRRKAIWAVKSHLNTANTEIWQWPAHPTGPYSFAKIATINSENFRGLYADLAPDHTSQHRTLWAGGNGSIYISTDSGLTWTVATTAPTGQISSFVRTTSGVLIAGGAAGEIFLFGGTGGEGGTTPPPLPPPPPTPPPSPPVNLAPVAHTQSVSAISGVPKAITLTGYDPEGQPLSYILFSQPPNGTRTGTAPNLTYTSSPGFVGTDSFIFQVYDGVNTSTAVQVTINVAAAPPPNTAPVANSQTVSAVQGVFRAITLTGSDAEGSPLTYTIVSNPSHGVLGGSGANRTYTSSISYAGNDSFTFRVNDGSLNSNIATVSIVVTATDPSPTPPPTQPPMVSGVSTAKILGQEPTCENQVYVANKFSFSNITHLFHFNGATFTTLQYAVEPPYELLGSAAAVNKAAYFGSKTNDTNVPGGPFSSLVFDILQRAENITVVWEYWNGSAWVTLTTQDNTEQFRNEGVGSVSWTIPTAWATTTVNSIVGYWVRARISAISAGSVTPIQVNRYVYTTLLPYAEVNENQVKGDTPALARIRFTNRASFGLERTVCGLRSLTRGRNFNAFINVSDTQAPFGISVSKGSEAGVAWQADKQAPTGRSLIASYSSAGDLNAWKDLAVVTISTSVAREYYGYYRALLRVFYNNASAQAWNLRLQLRIGSGGAKFTTDPAYPTALSQYEILDFKNLIIMNKQAASLSGSVFDQLQIAVQGYNTSTLKPLTLYDLILIPTDEWALDAIVPETVTTASPFIATHSTLDIDSIGRPKAGISVINRNPNGQIVAQFQAINNGPVILQKAVDQRFWFINMTYENFWKGNPEILGSVQIDKQQQYLGFRGRN